jgi:hypothetical protein
MNDYRFFVERVPTPTGTMLLVTDAKALKMRRVWAARLGTPGAARIAGRRRSRSDKKVIERIQ